MTEHQIKHMADRFLGWKLPANFNPDCGISFDPISNRGHTFESRREPVGTNLLDAEQARAMVQYIVEGLTPEADACSDARLRELWKRHGGVTLAEMDTLPDILRKIIGAATSAARISHAA